MIKKLLLCVTAPALLSAAGYVGATEAPSSAYVLEYKLVDPAGQIAEVGRAGLSKRRPMQMSTGYVRVSYISSCQPDSAVVTNEPKCETQTEDIGNTLQLALDSATPDAVVLTAWVSRQTLDGMQTIEHEGFATQRPLSHGWSDSKTVRVPVGESMTVPLRDQYKLTLRPLAAEQSTKAPIVLSPTVR